MLFCVTIGFVFFISMISVLRLLICTDCIFIKSTIKFGMLLNCLFQKKVNKNCASIKNKCWAPISKKLSNLICLFNSIVPERVGVVLIFKQTIMLKLTILIKLYTLQNYYYRIQLCSIATDLYFSMEAVVNRIRL